MRPPRRVAAPVVATVVVFLAALGVAACGSDDEAGRLPSGGVTSSVPSTTIPPLDIRGLQNSRPQDLASFAAELQQGLAQGGSSSAAGAQAAAQVSLASQFVALAGRVQAATYSVGYAASGPLLSALPIGGGDLKLTIEQRGQDLSNGLVAGGLASETIRRGTSTVVCARVASWTCANATPEQAQQELLTADGFLFLLAPVVQSPSSFVVQDGRTEIVGVPVRCLRATPVAGAGGDGVQGPIEVCVTAEGVPLRAVYPGIVALEGVWYRPSVAADAFTPPAPVS